VRVKGAEGKASIYHCFTPSPSRTSALVNDREG
jgi:hypothetical protein